ncbi:MAG TPA: ABC transporter permease [Candidatus Acidoferrales bacterium]|nr:ABC transporter permease [Candidatus Acidoferrales bacterium]
MNRRKEMMQDFDDDIREHIARETQDNIDRGMSPEEARFAAVRKFGNVTQVKEDTRGVWTTLWLEQLVQDIRNGLRMLRKSPGFAAVAILTLALGIGANTAIFSIVNSVVLQPLPYSNANQLVVVSQTSSRVPLSSSIQSSESYVNILDYQRDAKSFSAVAGYASNQMTLTGHGAPTIVYGAITSSGLFTTLGTPPLLGRTLESQDDVKGAGLVVVIGEGFWRDQLGADPNIIGKSIQLDSEPFTVVGVMPADFRYPDQSPPSEFWIPAMQSPDYASIIGIRKGRFLSFIGRLKSGVTDAQAEAELNSLYKGMLKQYGNLLDPTEVLHVSNLKRLVVGDAQPVLLILLGAVGLVVLIACANIANLLLARATGRAKEIAVRVALGAGRARIFRQLLTESVLLGICAGIAGLLLAYGGVASIKSFAAADLPHLRDISVDGWVLAFTFALSIFAGVLFGLAPAWQSSEIDLNEVLRENGRGSTGSARRRWTRNALVVVEVALAMILLIGSGLLLKSFYLLTHSSPGFDPLNVLVATVELPKAQYSMPEQWNAFFRQAVGRMKNLPGVEDAAAALPVPFTGSAFGYGFSVVGAPPLPPGQSPIAQAHDITPDYFRVMHMALLRGREFEEADTAPNAPAIVIIDQELARRYFAHQDPIGQSLQISGLRMPYNARIVGVVGDVKDQTMADAPTPMMYFPYTQEKWWVMVFVLRTRGNPSSLASALQAQIHDMDSSLPVQDVRPMTSFVSDSEGDARFRSILLGLFGILALVLASVGIYSVLAYVVAQRTHEIGIRMALGAQPRDVLRLVIGQGMRAVLIGTAIGIAAALAVSRLLAQFLYGVRDKDPLTFIAVVVLLMLVALAACYIPARRAMRIDPMVALRYE